MSPDEDSIPLDCARDIFDLSGRVAVVAGGGSGLGRAIAVGYAQYGVTVIVAAINENGAAETTATIAERGDTAIAAPLDATEPSKCVEVADAMRRAGRQDRVRQRASPVGGSSAQGGSPGLNGRGPNRTSYSIAG